MKLICPVCGQELKQTDRRVCCAQNHSFDYARQGYLNLALRTKAGAGDEKRMVKARTDFLHTGAYGFLRDTLCEWIRQEHAEVLADLGCGEGYYTSTFPVKEKYGFDLSKDALKYAAAHDKSTAYIVASTSRLPLPDACADLAVICFAPVFEKEISRILKDSGAFITVTPGPDHLFEMKSVLYEHPYRNPEKSSVSLVPEKEELIRQTFSAGPEDLANLLTMTPYFYRTSPEAARRLNSCENLQVTAEFILRLYRKTSPAR